MLGFARVVAGDTPLDGFGGFMRSLLKTGGGAVETRVSRLAALAPLIAAGLVFSVACVAHAADRSAAGEVFVSEGAPVKRITITVNKSRTFNVQRPFARAIVGSAEFADVLPLSDRAIYIQGKRAGTTNVSLFDGESRLMGVLDLEIVLDTGNMQEKIRGGTGMQGVRVTTANNQVILSGVASDAVAADRAMQVAKGLAGDQPVVNAMQVAPSQQVMLEVRFLEASRQAGRELGVNWYGTNGGQNIANTGRGAFATGTAGSVPIIQTAGTVTAGSLAGPFGSVLANVINNGTRIDVLVTALEEKGLVRRLAEPNLIALSGDEARFLAGGEFPVPIASSNTTGIPIVTIEFKKFGVQLKFKPIVLARGVINLRIEPEVSELDFTNAVSIGGTTIPALVKREALTTVELRDGQSFAIAGLLSSTNTSSIAQLPWIGSVPVLGALFRSAAYQQKETDLVIIVTPRLIAPIVPGQRVATPLDSRLPSTDVDFFLMGQPEVKKEYGDYVGRGGELKGPYGHMILPEPATPPANKR
jgi:pilus assembly protein CpaC